MALYAFGGDSSAIAPNDTAGGGKRIAQVLYAMLTPSTRDIIGWNESPAGLTDGRSASSVALGVGNLLITGGLYTGALTHTSENTFASLNANGSTGTFATAAPATSINSVCGCNLFNNGGTGYLAGDGSFHALVVGGDNVNAPGTPRVETYIYEDEHAAPSQGDPHGREREERPGRCFLWKLDRDSRSHRRGAEHEQRHVERDEEPKPRFVAHTRHCQHGHQGAVRRRQ